MFSPKQSVNGNHPPTPTPTPRSCLICEGGLQVLWEDKGLRKAFDSDAFEIKVCNIFFVWLVFSSWMEL